MVWDAVRTTLLLAVCSTVVLLVIGTPLAWWLSRSRHWGAHVVGTIVSLPLVLPPTVLGFYLLIALGPKGPLAPILDLFGIRTLAFSFPGLVIGAVVHSLPFVVRPLQSGFAALGNGPLEAAAMLRASPADRFFTVAVPMVRHAFLSSATLGFTHAVGEFGVVLMIGGNIPGKTRVLSTAIFEQVEVMNYSAAHTMAGGILLFSALVLFLLRLIGNRNGGVTP